MTVSRREPEQNWADALRSGDRRRLARALTAVENSTALAGRILADIGSLTGRAHVVGVTGPPGAGKSTLVAACIQVLRDQNLRVAVVAVDPSSPFSGGAVLGDRIRMQQHATDDGVFIRSLASRGELGGLCLGAARVIDVLDAAGMDIILVETVGTGQSEIEIADIADTRIVVVAPGLGDEVQALKAGVLEIADLLVVNKCDLPYADRCEADLKSMLALRRLGPTDIPILQTAATDGRGVDDLVQAVVEHGEHGCEDRELRRRRRIERLLIRETCDRIRLRLKSAHGDAVHAACERVLRSEQSLEQAADDLARRFEPE
jgi:LAO/AO transport system kinase